eukprot:3268008-Amphidinium_carterae.1
MILLAEARGEVDSDRLARGRTKSLIRHVRLDFDIQLGGACQCAAGGEHRVVAVAHAQALERLAYLL